MKDDLVSLCRRVDDDAAFYPEFDVELEPFQAVQLTHATKLALKALEFLETRGQAVAMALESCRMAETKEDFRLLMEAFGIDG